MKPLNLRASITPSAGVQSSVIDLDGGNPNAISPALNTLLNQWGRFTFTLGGSIPVTGHDNMEMPESTYRVITDFPIIRQFSEADYPGYAYEAAKAWEVHAIAQISAALTTFMDKSTSGSSLIYELPAD